MNDNILRIKKSLKKTAKTYKYTRKEKYNIMKWRHFFRLRTSDKAHPQMREIAKPILNEFSRLIPVVFDDIE